MHAYAASLTNAVGKALDPETIIVNQRVQPLKKAKGFYEDGNRQFTTAQKRSKF